MKFLPVCFFHSFAVFLMWSAGRNKQNTPRPKTEQVGESQSLPAYNPLGALHLSTFAGPKTLAGAVRPVAINCLYHSQTKKDIAWLAQVNILVSIL